MRFLTLLFLLFSFSSFSQKSIENDHNIILFGEAHFVKEKYDEIKSFVYKKINLLKEGDKIAFYFELPYSINFAFKKIENNIKDTSILIDWFKNVYSYPDSIPSYFWIDYRDFLLNLIQFSLKKGIYLELKGIDTELELRRTVFCLSKFEYNIGNTLDSLLSSNFVSNTSLTKRILINYIDTLKCLVTNKTELDILKTLSQSLRIDCDICTERNKFMYSAFLKNYDSTSAFTFVSLGLNHIIKTPNIDSASAQFRLKYEYDTLGGINTFYTLLRKKFQNEIYKVSIIAFNYQLKFGNFMKPEYFPNIMTPSERMFILKKMNNEPVLRIETKKFEELQNLNKEIDYAIIYYQSHFRW